MGFDDLPGDCQAKAAASLGTGLIAHCERGEQILTQGFRNAVAIVRQAQQDSGAGLNQRNPDAGAQPVMPQGVAEDIVQGSAHLEGVQTAGKAQGFRNIHLQGEPGQIDFIELVCEVFPQEFTQVGFHRFQTEVGVFGLAVLIEAVDELGEGIGLFPDDLQVLGQILFRYLSVPDSADIAGNYSDGRQTPVPRLPDGGWHLPTG